MLPMLPVLDDQYYFNEKIVAVILDNSRDRDKGKTAKRLTELFLVKWSVVVS